MLVALGQHDLLQVARHKVEAHALKLLRVVLLRQRQRRRHCVHLRADAPRASDQAPVRPNLHAPSQAGLAKVLMSCRRFRSSSQTSQASWTLDKSWEGLKVVHPRQWLETTSNPSCRGCPQA